MLLGIPFGRDKNTGEWKDVAEVTRGIDCNCVCPSCKLPLSARHGDEREWHFAHHTRNISKEDIVDCEFSFQVSLRMMIHQLFIDGLALKVPGYNQHITVPRQLNNSIDSIVTITGERLINTREVNYSIDSIFLGQQVDVIFNFGTATLIVYLSYRGREFPFSKRLLKNAKAGALIFDLEKLTQIFYRKPFTDEDQLGTARTQLLGWLKSSIEAKSWYYHPREDKLIDDRNNEINEALRNKKSATNHFTIPAHKLSKCKCLGCGHTFTGYKNMANSCPNCKTHLYVSNF